MALRETAKHLEAFEVWYATGRRFRESLGKVGVSEPTLLRWMSEFEWHERADERDAQARQKADSKAIEDTAKRLGDRRKTGTAMRLLVQNHFFKKGKDGKVEPYEFESTQAAINVLKEAVALEREGDGLPDFVVLALNADENTLQQKREQVIAELERRERLRRGSVPLPDGDGSCGSDGDDDGGGA
jgi:hypothetical protein